MAADPTPAMWDSPAPQDNPVGREHSAQNRTCQDYLLWDAGGHYDLAGTLGIIPRGTSDKTAMVTATVAWFAFNTAAGPATLGLSRAQIPGGGHAVRAQGWGPGASIALAGVPALLGAGDDWSGFDCADFQATLPRLVTEARRRHAAVRLPATGRMVDALISAVLEQKVTTIEARRGFAYLVARYGSPAPGIGAGSPVPADLMVAPTPAGWAAIPSWEWHKAGVGPQRSDTIMRLLRSATALERLAALPADQAATKLQTIPGIGIWTAAEVTQRTHGDPDAVAVGDFHLAKFVGWALAGKAVDDAGMLELLEPWQGHRQRVVRMLGLSGFRKPQFGPRLRIQDHRRH